MPHETHTICTKRLKQKGGQECCFCSSHSHCEFKEEMMKFGEHPPEKELCGYMILTPSPLHNGGMTCANKIPCKSHYKHTDNCRDCNDKGLDHRLCRCDCHVPPNATRHGEDGGIEECNHWNCNGCGKCGGWKNNPDIEKSCINNSCDCHSTCDICTKCYGGCDFIVPYGFVPEAGCPIHDAPIKDKKGIDYTKDNIYDGIGRPDLKPKQMAVEPSNWEKGLEKLFYDLGFDDTFKETYSRDFKDFIRTQIQLESDKAYRRGQRDSGLGQEKCIQCGNMIDTGRWLPDICQTCFDEQVKKVNNIPPKI